MRSRAAEVARDPEQRAALMKNTKDWPGKLYDWPFWAMDQQLPPEGAWRTWLMMAGRGFGKTRAGAEWIRAEAGRTKVRIALVGATRMEARQVMVEGPAGILAVTPAAERPVWQPTQGRLHWPATGAEAFVHSGENPEGLRGPQFHLAWCDELAKWAYPDATWDNLQMTLRLGEGPRALVTTTPRPIGLIRRLADEEGVKMVRGATRENVLLAPGFSAAMQVRYGGTRLGRQELEGELVAEVPGALWTRAMLEACRTRAVPALDRVVVAVDPPAGVGGDACGIVAVALGADGVGYVLEDASVAGLSPEGWARAVAACAARHRADRVVAEVNQGGAMVASVLRAAAVGLPVAPVHATAAKGKRAEPVAILYERGAVRHLGAFPELEDELCGMLAAGGYEGPGRSPDRADALVWAVAELMLGVRGSARVRTM